VTMVNVDSPVGTARLGPAGVASVQGTRSCRTTALGYDGARDGHRA
jgi:hypothetical protein